MAAQALSYSEFKGEVVNRLDGTVSKADVERVLKAFQEELIDCIVNGYKVSIPGLLRVEPKFVPGKAKGELVRNPATGEMQKRAAAVPESFKAKAYASSTVAKQFPSIRTKDGQTLKTLLAPAQRPAAPAAKANGASGRKTAAKPAAARSGARRATAASGSKGKPRR